MRVHRRTNIYQTRAIAQSVLHEIERWCGIDIILQNGIPHQSPILQVARKVESFFGPDSNGEIFIRSESEIAVLARSGQQSDISNIRKGLSEKILPYAADLNCVPLTIDYLKNMEEKAALQQNKAANLDIAAKNIRSFRSKKLVFVVDQSDFVFKVIKNALGQGCELQLFEQTDKVVDAYLDSFPDLVFVDVMAGGDLNGMGLLDKLRSYDDDACVILQADKASREKVMQAKALGAQGFLIKPFGAQKITDIMRAYKKRKK